MILLLAPGRVGDPKNEEGRILGYPGRCVYLYGHPFRLEVTVGAEQLDGRVMAIDFDDPKILVKQGALNRWDHTILLGKVLSWRPSLRCRRGTRKGRAPLANPTVETLA